MGYKFLIVDTDYDDFLLWLYKNNPGLSGQSYGQQMCLRAESLFGLANFYSSNLRKLGHEAQDIYANNESMQKAWAQEHGIKLGADLIWRFRLCKKIIPRPMQIKNQAWFYDVLAEQIRQYKPDILLNQAMDGISTGFLKKMRSYIRVLAGQHAATPLPDTEDFSCYNVVISSFPPTVDYFRKKGIDAELNRLGFEPRILSCLESPDKKFDLTFVGNFWPLHSSRAIFLEAICDRFRQIKIWSSTTRYLYPGSPIRKCCMGEVWGRRMFQVLHNSKITLNHHGDIAPYANNMRLYEATGAGALLITDWKKNLNEIFEPGKEVVIYHSPEECIELIQYYLEHDNERERIAYAGQQRTLKDHTYFKRMQKLSDIVNKYL